MTKVIVLDPAVAVTERFEVRDINTELASLQEIVGGYIEMIQLKFNGKYYDVVLNEEGKINNLPPNIAITDVGELQDIIMGTVFITKHDDEGEMTSLSEKEIVEIKKYFIETPRKLGKLVTLTLKNTDIPVLHYEIKAHILGDNEL